MSTLIHNLWKHPLWYTASMIPAFLVFLLVLSSPVLAASPRFLFAVGTSGTGDGQFDFPRRLAVNPSGNLFVTDPGNDRIQKWTGGAVPVRAITWGQLKQILQH